MLTNKIAKLFLILLGVIIVAVFLPVALITIFGVLVSGGGFSGLGQWDLYLVAFAVALSLPWLGSFFVYRKEFFKTSSLISLIFSAALICISAFVVQYYWKGAPSNNVQSGFLIPAADSLPIGFVAQNHAYYGNGIDLSYANSSINDSWIDISERNDQGWWLQQKSIFTDKDKVADFTYQNMPGSVFVYTTPTMDAGYLEYYLLWNNGNNYLEIQSFAPKTAIPPQSLIHILDTLTAAGS